LEYDIKEENDNDYKNKKDNKYWKIRRKFFKRSIKNESKKK